MPREGDVCDKCSDRGRGPEIVPEEYAELFRAAQILFDESITDEDQIIPTLAFAARSWEKPELRDVRDKFAEVQNRFAQIDTGSVARRSKEWTELDFRFFYSRYATLQAFRVVDGVLIVRSTPLDVLSHVDDETGLIDKIEINIYNLSVTAEEVADLYEKVLIRSKRTRSGVYDRPRGGAINLRADGPGLVTIEALPELNTSSSVARAESGGKWRQGAFPDPEIVRINCEHQFKVLKEEQDRAGSTPLATTKKTQTKKPHNLTPACVYWYVGNRGEVLDPRRRDLQHTAHDLLKRHLLELCADKIPNKVRGDFARDARVVERRILRVDRELQS